MHKGMGNSKKRKSGELTPKTGDKRRRKAEATVANVNKTSSQERSPNFAATPDRKIRKRGKRTDNEDKTPIKEKRTTRSHSKADSNNNAQIDLIEPTSSKHANRFVENKTRQINDKTCVDGDYVAISVDRRERGEFGETSDEEDFDPNSEDEQDDTVSGESGESDEEGDSQSEDDEVILSTGKSVGNKAIDESSEMLSMVEQVVEKKMKQERLTLKAEYEKLEQLKKKYEKLEREGKSNKVARTSVIKSPSDTYYLCTSFCKVSQ